MEIYLYFPYLCLSISLLILSIIAYGKGGGGGSGKKGLVVNPIYFVEKERKVYNITLWIL